MFLRSLPSRPRLLYTVTIKAQLPWPIILCFHARTKHMEIDLKRSWLNNLMLLIKWRIYQPNPYLLQGFFSYMSSSMWLILFLKLTRLDLEGVCEYGFSTLWVYCYNKKQSVHSVSELSLAVPHQHQLLEDSYNCLTCRACLLDLGVG
jgi:hypothetical protein